MGYDWKLWAIGLALIVAWALVWANFSTGVSGPNALIVGGLLMVLCWVLYGDFFISKVSAERDEKYDSEDFSSNLDDDDNDTDNDKDGVN